MHVARRAVMWVGLLWFAVAGAEPPEMGKAAARAHYQRGVAEYDLEHYQQALMEFEAGYTAMPEPAFLFNLATVHVKLGHKAEGLKFFRKYLAHDPPESEVAAVQATIDRLQGELDAAAAAPAPSPEPIAAPVRTVAAPVQAVVSPPPPTRRRVWPIAVGVIAAGVVVALTVGLAVGLSQPPGERVLDWSAR